MRSLLIPIVAVTVAGCGSREHPVSLNTYQTVTAQEPVNPAPASYADYRIGPLDKLRLDVLGEESLSIQELTVGVNGRINLPLVGEIVAEGRTPAELSRQIATALDRYLRAPQVAVNVSEYTSRRVTVSGAVRVPGVFQAAYQMTLQDALALGQGVNDFSRSSEILVFRRQGNQRYVARFDLGAIQAGQAADPVILPGDTIVVGFSAARRLFSDAIAVLPATVGIFLAIIN